MALTTRIIVTFFLQLVLELEKRTSFWDRGGLECQEHRW
jgi:hypothetical protein